jgi:hypothetical protein
MEFKDGLILISATLFGAGAGGLTALLLTAVHLLGPDNILGGVACGYGGVLAGVLTGAVIVCIRTGKEN